MARGRPMLHLGRAVNGVAALSEEDRVGHRRIVPLLRVPDLVHRPRRVVAGRRGIAARARRDRPAMALDPVDEHRHLLGRLVDIDEKILEPLPVLGALAALLLLGALGAVPVFGAVGAGGAVAALGGVEP